MTIERTIRRISIACLIGAATVAADRAAAAERVTGPVVAAVERAVDGDTLEVHAHLWLGLVLTVHVRVRGIDTPEIHQSGCPSEKAMGMAAKAKLGELAGGEVSLVDVENDKYGGRVDADVTAADGTDLRAAMIASGLARPYDGGERGDWCTVGSIAN